MEEGMVESMDSPAMDSPSEASILPFLLLVAVLVAGYWMWSSRGDGSGVTGAAAPLPNAEELRRKRLEALQASIDASKASESADGDGLRQRSVKVEGAEVTRSCQVKDASPEPKATPKQPEKQSEKQPEKQSEQPKPEPKPVHVQPQSPPVSKKSPEVDAVKLESTFSLRARATLKGSSHVRTLEVQADATVEEVQCEVLKAFPEAAGSKARIFFNGKELKTPSDKLSSLGLSSNVCLQVMFATQLKQEVEEAKPKEDVTDVKNSEGTEGHVPPEDEPLSVRIQSTVKGHTKAFVLEELTTCSTVLDLEAYCLGTFAPGDGLRPRLFFMGKELKEGNAYLGNVGLKPKAMATVQVMFAAGEPRVAAKTSISEAPVPLAEASAAAGGNPSPPVQEGTNEAVLAAAAAAGCNVSALVGGDAVEQVPEDGISPAEAWRAMAGLEEQLSRETDMSEEPSARQASMMLRQLLMTATHDSNPGLMQMAQSAVPDLKKIWSFEPTREHLKGLLAMKAQ